jgi:hypothetical protein
MPRRTRDPRLSEASGLLGALQRHHPEQDHSALAAEVARLATTDGIRRLVEAAPPLTKAQKAELVRIIRAVPSA